MNAKGNPMPKPLRPTGRQSKQQGAILIVCLMLMLITAILAGVILFLSRTEATISASTRGGIQAATAAEYGIEFAIYNLNPAQTAAPFPDQVLTPTVRVTAGLRDRSQAGATNQGPSPCPPGYSMSLACSAFTFTATGWAQGWLTPTASTQLQSMQSIYQGCRGTEYTCQ